MKHLIFTIVLFTAASVFANKDKWDAHQENWSPLMHVIYNGQTESFMKLIQQNADVNYITPAKEGSSMQLTALEVAIRVDNEKAITTLLATNKISRLNEALFTAAGYRRVSTIELLIKHGANPNYANALGHSVLMYATSFGSNEVMESLLKNGAKPNQVKTNGMTALMLACYGSNIDKIKLLIHYDATKDMKDVKGLTALDYFNRYSDIRKVSEENKTEIRALLQ